MKYICFLDETGDHGLSYIDKNFPLFLLSACLFKEDTLKEVERNVNKFKNQFFRSTQVFLHSRDIRRCNGVFQILFDNSIKKEFYENLNLIISKADYKIIASGINKEKHIKKYGKSAKDPYALSLSFIFERLIFCLDDFDQNGTVHIIAESRGNKEDQMLLSHARSVVDRGTYHVNRERMVKKIKKFSFCTKKDNVIGSQIADLSAYPLARHIIYPKEPYPSFDIIKSKIYCDKKGKYDGWGLKVFP